MPAPDDEAPAAASQSRPSVGEGAQAAAATDANPAPTLYRSGWASTVTSPMKQSFVPTTEARRESEVHRQAREAKAAAEKQREREARRAVEEEADAKEEAEEEAGADTGEQQQLKEAQREELDVHDFDREEKGGETAIAEEQTEKTPAEGAGASSGDADVAAARESAPAVDAPQASAELEQAEEGKMEANASDGDTGGDKRAEEPTTEPKVAWWRNKKYRIPILVSLLVTIGGIIGLAVGLSGSSDGGNADDGASSDNTLDQIPLVVDRSESCEFELKDTAFLSAAGNMTGGRADTDGDNAVVAAHDENGVGAVWALSKNGYTWTAQTPLPSDGEDEFGWDVAIRGETIVVGSPGAGGGRGAAHVFRKNQDGAWYLQQILEPENAEPDSAFGTSVDIAECECIIAVGGTRGSVFVFTRQSGDNFFFETQKETPNVWKSQFSNGGLGQTVAISDNLLAVKAPSDFIEEEKGVVYMYKRGADGIYEEVDRLSAPEGGLYTPEGEQFTPSNSPQVVLLDDFVLVGAPGLNVVHVFQETPLGRYQKVSELVAFDATPGSNRAFGHRLDGDRMDVLVSDPVDNSSYLFSYDGGVWNGGMKHDSAAVYVSSPIPRPATVISVASEQNEFGPVNVYDIACR
ncbi:hypothetical protein ACHAXT_013152 [Thalassiosira profunda]